MTVGTMLPTIKLPSNKNAVAALSVSHKSKLSVKMDTVAWRQPM